MRKLYEWTVVFVVVLAATCFVGAVGVACYRVTKAPACVACTCGCNDGGKGKCSRRASLNCSCVADCPCVEKGPAK